MLGPTEVVCGPDSAELMALLTPGSESYTVVVRRRDPACTSCQRSKPEA